MQKRKHLERHEVNTLTNHENNGMQMNKSIGNNKFDNKRYCEGKQGEKNRFMMTISYETRTLREALGVPLRFSDVFSSMYILGQQ